MNPTSQRIFISDCEGPISKNDNAFELVTHFIPQGDRFFALISRYDDILADIVRKPGYKAGDTLKLILPFLKAYGATNQGITDCSSENMLLVPGAKHMLKSIRAIMPSFIVSTSYEQYIRALCSLIGFPYQNAYCTQLDLDRYQLEEKEREQLEQLRKEISTLPMLEIPENTKSLRDFPTQHQETVKRLDEIFWEEIDKMGISRILKEVNPVGGYEKAEVVKNIAEKLVSKLSNMMYVGDSITDISAFQHVRGGEGLAISFNGNAYAVREAEIAVLSENAVVTALLADVFNKLGKQGVFKLTKTWNHQAIERFGVDSSLRERIFKLYPRQLPRVETITPGNKDRLIKESSAFRKTVRGEAIGKLG
ncbi:MAG: HAD hydrolase family protein [Candidatus Bathyarchaeota archaeon]|jgi:energy-converting hydrogenase A subunit R